MIIWKWLKIFRFLILRFCLISKSRSCRFSKVRFSFILKIRFCCCWGFFRKWDFIIFESEILSYFENQLLSYFETAILFNLEIQILFLSKLRLVHKDHHKFIFWFFKIEILFCSISKMGFSLFWNWDFALFHNWDSILFPNQDLPSWAIIFLF